MITDQLLQFSSIWKNIVDLNHLLYAHINAYNALQCGTILKIDTILVYFANVKGLTFF